MPATIHYPADAAVINNNDEGDHYYVITRGEVEVFQLDDRGEKVQLRVLKSGDHFGEIALLKGIPRTANVRTLTPCDLLVFTREEFLLLIQHNAHLRDSFEHEAIFLMRAREETDEQ